MDTSSACNMQPGLIEWAVREVGADKILFGTDSPSYFTPMQRARIDYADISKADKRKILSGNADKLFNL
ncbi:MAG: amidohydrolase family protein [Lentisphaerae bacterium]|nr:amidohydrolase family protein [Lentisphaerota bacterium]